MLIERWFSKLDGAPALADDVREARSAAPGARRLRRLLPPPAPLPGSTTDTEGDSSHLEDVREQSLHLATARAVNVAGSSHASGSSFLSPHLPAERVLFFLWLPLKLLSLDTRAFPGWSLSTSGIDADAAVEMPVLNKRGSDLSDQRDSWNCFHGLL
jgi:hypothetical protein